MSSMSKCRSWTLAILLCIGFAAGSRAEPAREPGAVDSAKTFMEAGELGQAATILAEQDQSDPEILFLEGQIAGAQGRWNAAEAFYREILEKNPDARRVILELARSLFEQGDDIGAEYQFRKALSAAPETEATVGDFLQRIRERKRWSGDLFLGGIADGNMNRSTSAGEVSLFGLPFILSQQAKQKSGFGANLALSGEYSAALADNVRLRSGADFYRNEYEGGQFDDMQVAPYIGPRLFQSWGDVSVLALVLQRWYGNTLYYYGYGSRIEARWNGSGACRLDGTVQVAKLWYPNREFLNGFQVDVLGISSCALGGSNFLRGIAGVGHQTAADKSWQNDYGRLGGGYGADLWWGVSIYVEPSATYYSYDGQSFGQDRRDWLISAAATLSKPNWSVLGLSPSLTLGYQRDLSTVELFSYQRKYALVGLSRQF